MARGNLPAQTPQVPRDSFIAFDLLYRHVIELNRDLQAVEGATSTADPAIASNTTLTTATGFSLELQPQQKVAVSATLFCTSNLKLRHAGPAGASLVMLRRQVLAAASAEILDTAYSAADIVITAPSLVTIEGIVHNGATAGAFSILAAQSVSSLTPSGFYPGSVFRYSLIA